MFRPVSHPLVFSAMVGTGYHIAVVVFLVIIAATYSDMYTE